MADDIDPDTIKATKDLQNAVGEFAKFVRGLPDDLLMEKAWGPKEVLAHLVFWLESYVTQVKAILAEETPELLSGHFDDLNQNVVEASRGVSVSLFLHRHKAACDWLCDVAYTHDSNKIVLVLKKGSSFRHPLTKYLRAEANHIRWHQNILQRQINRTYLQDIDQLQETVAAFCQFIRQLPDDQLTEQEWGVKEALSYLIFWHERSIAQIEAIFAKEPFIGADDRLKDLKTQAIAESRGVSVRDLLQRFEATDERLCHFGKTLDPQEIIIKVQAHRSTLEGAILDLARQINNHHRKLRQVSKH